MIVECSMESFQCGSRCLGNQAVCDDLPPPGQGSRIGNKDFWDLGSTLQRRADVPPSGGGMIDALESVLKQNQGSGIAEAIRVRL